MGGIWRNEGARWLLSGSDQRLMLRTGKSRNEFPYQTVADPEAKIYLELGTRRNIAGTWGIPLLINCAEKHVAGNLSFAHYEGDDLELLGGDFIADSLWQVSMDTCYERS